MADFLRDFLGNMGTPPKPASPDIYPDVAKALAVPDLRVDGSPKGEGFFGRLARPDGGVSTELSIGVNFDGKETEIPLLVPTLTQEEVDYLLNEPPGGRPVPNIIAGKAIRHAIQRMKAGLSPFAQPGTKFVTPIQSGAK